jgi:hypothetical protein
LLKFSNISLALSFSSFFIFQEFNILGMLASAYFEGDPTFVSNVSQSNSSWFVKHVCFSFFKIIGKTKRFKKKALATIQSK